MTTDAGYFIVINILTDYVLRAHSLQYTAYHSLSYTLPADAKDVYIIFFWESPSGTYSLSSTDCPGGCTAHVDGPSDDVGGTFTDHSEVYWAPGQMVNPPIVIDVGKSYIVAGQDATGAYRKILVSCEWVWVRAETVGPNYDEVWKDAPLPTTVVE